MFKKIQEEKHPMTKLHIVQRRMREMQSPSLWYG